VRAFREGRLVVFLKEKDPLFLAACVRATQVLMEKQGKADIQPTKRQVSKWLAVKGAAFKFGRS
jgi:hypothetical protein